MQYSVEEILSTDANRWDRLISADLASELNTQLGEKITIPEVRRFLAAKGYRDLRHRVEADTAGFTGEEAVRKMALAFRSFALERPGLAAATFRNAITDSPEWRMEGELLAGLAVTILQSSGLDHAPAKIGLRMLRALVRGFVLHEMSDSFMDNVDYEAEYSHAVSVFVNGLSALRGPIHN
jgi:hypothetical protein